jgi:hypothetical protein
MVGYSLEGISSLGQINSESITLAPSVEPMPLPMVGSASTYVFHMSGVLRTITLSGALSTSSLFTDFMDDVETIVNAAGGQLTTLTYVSDVCGSIEVKITNCEVSYTAEGQHATYTLTLMESQ